MLTQDRGLLKRASVEARSILLDTLAGWQTLARNGRPQRAQLQADQARQRARRAASPQTWQASSLAGSQDGDDLLLGRLYSTSTLPAAALAEELPVQDEGGGYLTHPPAEMGAQGEQAAEALRAGLSRRPSSAQVLGGAPGRRQAQEVPAERLKVAGQPSADVDESAYDDAVGEAAIPVGDEAAWPQEVSQPQSPRSEAAPARRLARDHSRSFLQPGSGQPGSSVGPGAELGQPIGAFWTSTEGEVSKTQPSCRTPSRSSL